METKLGYRWDVLDDPDDVHRAIRATAKAFYVYVLLRPDEEPFYIGKGRVRTDNAHRILQHEAQARNTTERTHKLNVIRSILRSGRRLKYAIAGFFDEEGEALAFERRLIREIGRFDLGAGPLTNQTDGGEGTSNPSEESRARRAATLGGAAADPDRRLANEFFASIAGGQDSVPVKPLGTRRLEFTTPHPSQRQPTERMAKALVAAALATDTALHSGVILPRVFRLGERPFVIENGVSRDMLKAAMIELSGRAVRPEDERFVLTSLGFAAVVRLIGRARLIKLGAIDPG